MREVWLLLFSLLSGLVLVVSGCNAPADVTYSPEASSSALAKAEDLSKQLGIVWSQQDVGLWVNGEGKVSAIPDIAVLRLGVETQQKSVAEAQHEASQAMDEIMKVLKANGIAEKDIQTQRFSIYPVRRWIEEERREELTGYRVNNMVTAKIRKPDETGIVIDAVAKAGGDTIRIEGISFDVDDPTAHRNEARKKAVEDAKAKAKQIAGVAGIELGKPLYISEGVASVPPVRELYKAVEGGPVPSSAPTAISPGELEFTVTVTMVYAID